MARFLKIFLTLLTITIVGFGLYYYFNNNSNKDNKVRNIFKNLAILESS